MTDTKCPIGLLEIMAALAAGKFKPFTGADEQAFGMAGPDARIWHDAERNLTTIIDPSEDTIDVYDVDGDNSWTGPWR